jgi:hypothetical protein
MQGSGGIMKAPLESGGYQLEKPKSSHTLCERSVMRRNFPELLHEVSGLMAQLQEKNRLLAESEAKVCELELQLKPVEATIEGDTWENRVCLLVGDSLRLQSSRHPRLPLAATA